MLAISRLVVPWAAFSSLAVATTAGHFNDTSVCADPKGIKKCYEKAETSYANCIMSNCSDGSKGCYDSCNGDTTCMATQCPNIGIDCINACGCVRATDQIDCTASSCWNQVYSCEYQQTAQDVLDLCLSFDIDRIPFWPAPENAPGGCSCNIGNLARKETLISAQLTECSNNMTNLDQLSEGKNMTDYAQACVCCAQSAIVSAIWGVCPSTKPSEIGVDDWYNAFLGPHHWKECGPYLEAYDCGSNLGYAAESAGDTHTFYRPNSLPKNGTETLYNTGGILSTPVSGATFTWTDGSLLHGITAASTNNVVSATGAGAQGATATATGTGASASKTGGATIYSPPTWAGAGMAMPTNDNTIVLLT
ncbi:hypothetical protein PMG11_08227 [Penicillium brasilianum]|uniref:Uncharacterized protein n=1 Tax=Penicillium brasilianum TaxID=104259 RepID=A0A0F7TW47_PENBI|nr:hypothetical protein PMG11_08227 [Penicillium brasilianum]